MVLPSIFTSLKNEAHIDISDHSIHKSRMKSKSSQSGIGHSHGTVCFIAGYLSGSMLSGFAVDCIGSNSPSIYRGVR
jgi:hypothetical protein